MIKIQTFLLGKLFESLQKCRKMKPKVVICVLVSLGEEKRGVSVNVSS